MSLIMYSIKTQSDKTNTQTKNIQYWAKPGDSIYKKAFSDTLSLIKDNKVYFYTFKKLGNTSD